MANAEIQEKVINITAEILGVDAGDINAGSHFRDDLNADSLDLVDLIMQFEDEFGGDISDEDAQKIETVGQAINYIETHMG